MQERQVSIEGETRPLPDPFIVLATQNPIEYEGTFSLPEAQLDRFLVRIRIGYPDRAAEARIASRYLAEHDPLDRVQPILDRPTLLGLRDAARQVHVSPELTDHLVAIVAATRERPDIELGGSPRASVALFRAAQADRPARRPRLRPARRHPARSRRPSSPIGSRLSVDSALHGQSIEGAFAETMAGVPVPVGPAGTSDRPMARARTGRAWPGRLPGPTATARAGRAHRLDRTAAGWARPYRGSRNRGARGRVPTSTSPALRDDRPRPGRRPACLAGRRDADSRSLAARPPATPIAALGFVVTGVGAAPLDRRRPRPAPGSS